MSSVEIRSLGPRTTAYLQPPGGWFLNNAGWIGGTERLVLVDTCATAQRSRHLIEQARSTDRDLPLSAVLTHAHGDHANGAGHVERAGGTVHATPTAAEEVRGGPHTHPEIFGQVPWGEISPPERITPVPEPAEVDLGRTRIELHPVPNRAHTGGDLVVHHPAEGVLFTGDLLFSGVTPLALHGSIAGWLDALDWVKSFGASTFVPGHGPITTATEAVLDRQVAYLRWLLDVTAIAEPEYDTLQQRARQHWPEWHDAERHAVNLRRAHAENHGHEFDLAEAALAMLSAAGGRIQLDL
ncbi:MULTISPECIES: MBL fold metallo-hydrolase [unclassified Actinopolyspora]|uniref:MBL fold metallo-hydrolase n=1 Tax=unclassified Actinopolyspora TaxID=2639451 RepID=UPI0013F5A9B6|nr:MULTISPECIES: MBL fold metallo-hydrolase [unclassified Actinopolyspora]NHD15838.1 MBL fold metallo-hydrolase [Actinopolyspora sp. BKK2]NHE74948.1 MBL fold metallo-hydrolase [Actinopolyspora sp. BKK1]